MDLKEAQAQVDGWISQFEEGYWPPLVNLARLMEEVGELAREMNHRFGAKTKKAGEQEQELAAWFAWFEGLGDAILDSGNPTSGSVTVGSDRSVSEGGGANPLSGYSLIKADNLDAALAILREPT